MLMFCWECLWQQPGQSLHLGRQAGWVGTVHPVLGCGAGCCGLCGWAGSIQDIGRFPLWVVVIGQFLWGSGPAKPQPEVSISCVPDLLNECYKSDTFVDGTSLAETWLLVWKQFL
jgi:hypothetical protein